MTVGRLTGLAASTGGLATRFPVGPDPTSLRARDQKRLTGRTMKALSLAYSPRRPVLKK
jgi:hypothetical protein